AARRAALFAREARRALGDEGALRFARQLALPLRIRAAVADDLVASRAVRRHDFGAVVVQGAVGDRRDRQAKRVEELQAAPGADAVAVVAPAVIEDVGLRAGRRELRAQSFAEGKVLEVVADVEREALALRPSV